MNISLRPESIKFVEEQVRAGRFESTEEVLEAALNRMREEESEMDDATVAAINRAESQLDRGEGLDFEQFAEDWRKRLRSGN